jgi:hypothetical protein
MYNFYCVLHYDRYIVQLVRKPVKYIIHIIRILALQNKTSLSNVDTQSQQTMHEDYAEDFDVISLDGNGEDSFMLTWQTIRTTS